MVIADRGFCDLWTLAAKKFHGEIATELMKQGTGGWVVNNAWKFLQPHTEKGKKCYKVVMCDIHDEIVNVHCSLMVGIAKEICRA